MNLYQVPAMWKLKKEKGWFFLGFSNIDIWRSIMLDKLLEYVYCTIGVSVVLLCRWYVPKIHFYLYIFQGKKTSIFKPKILSFHCNCNCRGHDIYEVKQGLAMLVLGWVTAWCEHSKVPVFSCSFHWLGTVSKLLCCR